MAAPYEILDEEELGRKDAKPPAPLQHRQQVRADIIAGSLAALMVLVFNVITAGVVFSPGDQLEDSMSDGVVLTLLATCSTTLVLLLCSQLPMVTGGDVFLAAMYGHHIKGALLDVDEPFATLVVAMSVCSLLLGIMCWVMGTLQAGKLVQFLPTPVMTGYLAAIGYVMLDSAAVMAAGCSLLEPECLLDSPDAPQLGLALVAGALLYVAQKLTSGLVQTVLSPAVLVALTLGFTVLRAAWGDEALSPWAMHVDASPASLWRALAPVAALDSAAWRAALRAAAATASVVALPMAVGRLLGISAVQSRYDVDVEFNRELRMNSLMYVASAATGGLAIGPSIASSLLMSEMGGRTKLAPQLVKRAVCPV
jgi:SulP family sulfate permease